MATTPTTNPIPSGSVQDLKFNSEKIDEIVTSDSKTYTDRFGVQRYTWAGALANIAPLGHPWTETEAADAIASGEIPNDAYYFVWSSDSKSIADVWQNVNGTGTKTDKSYPSSEFVFEIKAKLDFLYDSNAKNVSGFPGIAEMATDKNGNVTFQRLDDGTAQFPAVMVGSNIEQVQTSDGSSFQSRATGSSVLGLSEDGSMRMLKQDVIISRDYPEYSEVHADRYGEIFKLVKRNGEVVDLRDDGDAQSEPEVSAEGGLAIEVNGVIYFIHTNGDNFALTVDAGNNTPVTFKAVNGEYFVKFASQEGGSGDFKLHRASVATASRIRQGNADFIHIIIVGQSLAVGGATITQPAVTVTPRYPYGAMTFNGGPKFDSANPAKSVAETDLEYLVPMAENIGKVSGQESDCGGIAERLFEKSGVTCMASATGASGTTLANISYGTASFNATKLVMQRAHDISVGLGMNYKPFLLFIHGNADAVMNTNANVYKDLMLNLRIDYQTYLRSLLDDDEFTLKVFVQQFSNATVQAGATGADVNLVIGNAQYEVCRDNPEFTLTGTQYARPYVDKDHLSNNGYRTDGEIVGVAIAEFIRNDGVMALRPDEANIIQTSSEIIIPLFGGVGNAVIDAVRVSDPGNYGFKLVGATITGVTISTGNVIHIAKTGVATAVNYAYTGNRANYPGRLTGNRGCIRDSATDVSPVSGLPLYNDLVAFNKSL
ncbi:hypothetical protein [Serratia grimesii]|uniref:hypothetical protein n=1 Tax=Serratia grimesii TaxID=82995 RepID=UPI00077C9B70|nr:hypothetical protein [Serratia grimesii]CAI0723721.1 Uncharacterised protein [Serratia grimesii]CAI2443801.1 Uncharacterised protein [Serratia grimesii]SUI32714.1 Uncharacterised protein [Serratia grimesii]